MHTTTLDSPRPYALVTGASSGIGMELARCCAEAGWDLLVVADEPQIAEQASRLRDHGGHVQSLQTGLTSTEAVDQVMRATGGRPIDALLANAGRGLGKAFLDQDFDDVRRVVDTNVTGTIALLQRVGREMRSRNRGRILITGSIAGFLPGAYQAVYNGTKAFLDSFSYALREELKGSGVSVTCLMPGPTDTEFFERADLLDTKVGSGPKDDAAVVARQGFDAMMAGRSRVITGLKNKAQVMGAHVTPDAVLAGMHARQTAPGTARNARESRRSMVAPGVLGCVAIGSALWLLSSNRRGRAAAWQEPGHRLGLNRRLPSRAPRAA